MNRYLPISLAVLPSLMLRGADFTADDLRRSIDKIRLIELNLPADMPAFSLPENGRMSCAKCGKVMLLDESPLLMRALAERLNEKSSKGYRFILDESALCPYCGDGRFYLDIQVIDLSPQKINWKKLRRIPVDRDDLLFLLSGWETLQSCEGLAYRLRNVETGSFLVESEEDFLSDARVQPPGGWKKRIDEQQETAEFFQKLASSAHILRREDLDSYLKMSADLSDRHNDYRPSHFMLLTRMAISFDRALTPLNCPACSRRYYVCNGSNMPLMQPLGDLLEAMKKIDIFPDFSSLCPYCHPGKEERKLAVTIHAEGQKALSAELTPGDLVLLADFVTYNDSSQYQTALPAVMVMRLKEVLLGETGNARISARPLPAGEK